MKAVILAAGRGQRLKPLTDKIPKPLIEVQGQRLIDYHLYALSAVGIKDIAINVCYLADKIRMALGSGSRYGVNIHYSNEPQPLDTGGGIKKLLDWLDNQPFIIVNSDVLTDYPFQRLTELTFSQWAHLVMVPNPPENPQGDFAVENGFITYSKVDRLTYSGIALLHPALFANCQETVFSLTQVLRPAINQGQVTGEIFLKKWYDAGSFRQLKTLNTMNRELYEIE